MNNPQFQQLLRAGLLGAGGTGQQNLPQNMAALMRPQGQSNRAQAAPAAQLNKSFPGKLTQIKEFPIEKSNQQPYKLQKALGGINGHGNSPVFLTSINVELLFCRKP